MRMGHQRVVYAGDKCPPAHCIGRRFSFSGRVNRSPQLSVNGIHHRHQAFRSAIVWRLLENDLEEIFLETRSRNIGMFRREIDS